LTWESGSFRVEFGPVDREAHSDAGTQALLMEGMRRIDEMARLAETLPLSTVLGVDFPALAAQLAEMPDELNGVLRLFDGRRTMREILSDSPLDDLSTMGVVQRLMSDGVLMHGAPVTPRRKPSLQQWLGSVPPPPREAAEASSPDGAAVPDAPPLVVDTPPEGQPRAAAKAQPDAGAGTRPDGPEGPTPPRGVAPGASPDPGTAEAAARPRRGNGDAGSDEISAALADAVAETQGGAAPLEPKDAAASRARTQPASTPVVNPGTVPERAGAAAS